jgi:hypothetical protein
VPKFLKGGQDDDTFKGRLEKFIDKHVNLKCDSGNLSETFTWCWKEKFPLAVFLLNFDERSQPAIKKFFSDDLLVEKIISEQFKVYGLSTRDYQLENELKPFFNFQRDANNMVICRVNHLDEINVVSRINLNDSMEDIRRRIKQAKSECIQNELD